MGAHDRHRGARRNLTASGKFTGTAARDRHRGALCNQLGKRNLTPEEQAYHRGLLYENEKNDEAFKGNQHTESGGDKTCPHLKTADALAAEFGVSRTTIKNDAAFAKGVDAIAEAAENRL
jgi:hypothetical protein